MQAEFKYRDSTGNVKTGYMTLDDYRLAADHNMRAAAVVNARHSDADPTFGTAFEQGMKYLGIYPKGDTRYGIKATTMREILDGTCTSKLSGYQMASGGSIVSPKGPVGGSTPASRLFYPEVVLGFVEEELLGSYGPEEAGWSDMIGMTTTISGDTWTQPMINTTAPRDQDMRPIGQNQMPASVVSITASQTSHALGAISIGIQLADQALKDTTLDLVGIIVREQMMGQRLRMLWRDLNRVVTGNPDNGETALTPVDFTDYDATAPANTITHSGYLNMLWQPDRVYSWSHMFGPLSSYLAIENRAGRPLMYDPATSGINMGNAGSYGLNPGNPRLVNFTTANPSFLVVPDGVVAANTVVLLDKRYALYRVVSAGAQYSAVEQQVLQRSTFMRFDISEFTARFRSDAIKVVDFTNPS